jgi:hypothetical protein
VLILIGLRLGLDGVNPIYYDSIKVSRNCLCRYRYRVATDSRLA